jgi:cytochrome c-type biogenesis protein CcmH/NrfF
MRRAAAVLAIAVGLLVSAPAAALACTGWSEPDMETQLMCPTCHLRLDESNSVIADQIRSFLHQKCAAGWTATRVKATLIAQFGPEILAAPPRHGFDLLAWIVPGAVLLAGAVVAAALALRWSRARAGPPAALSPPDAGLAARIDADVAGLE